MATKKKPAAKSKKTVKKQLDSDSQSVRLLVMIFTFLCLIFAITAYWQYG